MNIEAVHVEVLRSVIKRLERLQERKDEDQELYEAAEWELRAALEVVREAGHGLPDVA